MPKGVEHITLPFTFHAITESELVKKQQEFNDNPDLLVGKRGIGSSEQHYADHPDSQTFKYGGDPSMVMQV